MQAYLNVPQTKGDIAMDNKDRNQFPICGFNFSKMGVKIRTEGTWKLPVDEPYLGLRRRLARPPG